MSTRSKLLFPLFLALLIDGIGVSLIFPILNVVIIEPATTIIPGMVQNDRNIIYGLLVGTYFLCWFFGTVIISDWSDKAGRKIALMLCLFGTFLGYVCSAIGVATTSVTLLFLGRIIDGFTTGSQPLAQSAIIDLCTEKEKSRFIAFISATMLFGFVLGPLLASVLENNQLVSWFSPLTPLYFAAILSFLNAMILQLLFKETHQVSKQKVIHIWHAFTLFKEAFIRQDIRFISVMFLIIEMGWSAIFSFSALYFIHKFSLTESAYGYYYAIIGLGFTIGALGLIKPFEKCFTLVNRIIISGILAGCFLTSATFVTGLYVVALFSFLMAGTIIINYSSILTLFSNQISADRQGWIMGIADSVKALAFAITSMLAAWLSTYNTIAPLILGIFGIFVGSIGFLGFQAKVNHTKKK